MARRRSGPPCIRSTDTDLGTALEAMTAPELHAFVRAVLDELKDEQRRRVSTRDDSRRQGRWLVTGDRRPRALRVRARKIVSRCPETAGRQLGLLRLLAGDIRAAADLLSQAPGLGRSSDEHPGHVLFPSFALLLAHRTSSVPDALLADLDSTCRDPVEALSPDDVERRRATPGAGGTVTPPRCGIMRCAGAGGERQGPLRVDDGTATDILASSRIQRGTQACDGEFRRP